MSTGRSSIVHDLVLAERLAAQANEAGTRTAKMDVSDVMSLLVAEQRIAQDGDEPGRSGTRPAMRGPALDASPAGAAPGVPVPREPDVSVEFEWVAAPDPGGLAAVPGTPPLREAVQGAPGVVRAPSLRPRRRRSGFRRFLAATLFVTVMSGAFYLLVEAGRRAGLRPRELVPAALEWGRSVLGRR